MNGKNIQSIYGISGQSKWTTGTDCHRELSDLSSNLSSAKNTSHQSGGPRWPISLWHNEARHDWPYGTAVVLRVQKLRRSPETATWGAETATWGPEMANWGPETATDMGRTGPFWRGVWGPFDNKFRPFWRPIWQIGEATPTWEITEHGR